MEIRDTIPDFPITTKNRCAADNLNLVVGQHANVKVLQAGAEGLWQISLNGKELWVHSQASLSPGQTIRAEISQTGSSIQLQILEDTGNPENATSSAPLIANDLLKIIAARSALLEIPLMDAPAWRNNLHRLLAASETVLTPDQTGQLAKLLAPIELNASSQQLAEILRMNLGNSGLFFESKLRQLLETMPAAPNQAIARLAPDLKNLLGQMARSIDEAGNQSPPPEWTISAAHLKNRLIEQLLMQQTEVAYQWMKDGAFCAEFPLQLYAQNTEARIRFFLKSPQETVSADRPLTVSVSLCLPETGKLEAWAQWQDDRIHARIYVEKEEIRQLFQPKVQELINNLRGLGFSAVAAEILTDPVRLLKSDSMPEEEPILHGGSLINLRA